MAEDAYLGRLASCDCNFGARVVPSGLAVRITPKWVMASTTFIGVPGGPKVGAVAAPLIMATDLVGWTMRLLWEG